MAGRDFPMQFAPGAKWPGEMVDEFGHAVTRGAQQIISTIGGGIRQAGESVQQGLDKPAEALNLKHSPFRVIDDPLKGASLASERLINDGVIDGIRTFYDSITDGLDRIPDTFAGRGPSFAPPFARAVRA